MSELTQAELTVAAKMGLTPEQYAHGKRPPEIDLRLAGASFLTRMARSCTAEERDILLSRAAELIQEYDRDQDTGGTDD